MEKRSVCVVIATRNRHAAILETMRLLRSTVSEWEGIDVVVVDDGSSPRVELPRDSGLRVLRVGGEGRSAARNAGANASSAGTLVFLDDDMSVAPGFVEAHVRAQAEWPGALAVGAVRLPNDLLASPFGRFRQQLEDAAVPTNRGITQTPNFCTAQNMSIPRSRFLELGGFDPALSSGEDQELALRHSSTGGRIAFIPEALAVHRDHALDIRSYCLRVEWGAEHDVAFVKKQPDWPENEQRRRINGPLGLGREPFQVSVRKVSKTLLGYWPLEQALFLLGSMLERVTPDSSTLERLYRILLGIHIRRGYMRGLRALRGE